MESSRDKRQFDEFVDSKLNERHESTLQSNLNTFKSLHTLKSWAYLTNFKMLKRNTR